MIEKVKIQNFKSVLDSEIDISRFNVFIGENGCGKSNILEGIAFGAAAAANQLGTDFLASRGIRITQSNLFRSVFTNDFDKEIAVNFIFENKKDLEFRLQNDNEEYSTWFDIKKTLAQKKVKDFFQEFLTLKPKELAKKYEMDSETAAETFKYIGMVKGAQLVLKENDLNALFDDNFLQKILETGVDENEKKNTELVSKFLIYSPENYFLRRFEDEEKISPLGIRGEGLFKLFKNLSQDQEKLNEIIHYLYLLDWFDGIQIKESSFESEKILKIKDRYVTIEDLNLTQNSANEGFLFLLFYLCLFISEDTPSFFAIDNIEASFNPKLCIKIIQVLNDLSKKYNKQVILTTHNPFVLNGLNLKDKDQKLISVYRNRSGQTKVKSIPYIETDSSLSEMWVNGLFGGLPKNF
jgi:AAA15 family ATPase/GTPase